MQWVWGFTIICELLVQRQKCAVEWIKNEPLSPNSTHFVCVPCFCPNFTGKKISFCLDVCLIINNKRFHHQNEGTNARLHVCSVTTFFFVFTCLFPFHIFLVVVVQSVEWIIIEVRAYSKLTMSPSSFTRLMISVEVLLLLLI